MISLDEARRVADTVVDSLNKDRSSRYELAIMHTSVSDVGRGWLFHINSLEYVKTGDHEYALLGGHPPFIVAKEDGSLHFYRESGEFGDIIKGIVEKKYF